MALRVAARVPWGLHRSILSGRGHDGTHPGDPLPPRVRSTFRISLGSALEVDCAPGATADTGIPTESPRRGWEVGGTARALPDRDARDAPNVFHPETRWTGDGRPRRAGARPVEELRRSRGRPPRCGPRCRRSGGGPRLRAERQWEDHAPLDPRRPRRTEPRVRDHRRPGDLASQGIRACKDPVARRRVRVPDPQPHRRFDGRGERRAASPTRPQAIRRSRGRSAYDVPDRATGDPPTEGDFRRGGTAGRGGPGPRERPEGDPRG